MKADNLGGCCGLEEASITKGQRARNMTLDGGADLPLLLIFAGVVGGLLAFGLVGVFVGP
jgi:hypothetical protein